jgi:hypothetical protein
MQRIALALTLILFSVSASAHGPGTDFVVNVIVFFTLAPCVITVPVAMLLPNLPRGDRIGIGVCTSVAAGVVGGVAAVLLPSIGGWLYLGVLLLAVAGLLCYVVVERSQANAFWPFPEATTFGVSCSRAILEAGKPIALVARHNDGSWRFFDGEPIHPGDEPANIPLKEIYRLDPTVAEVADLGLGWRAERSGPTMPWSRAKIRHDG